MVEEFLDQCAQGVRLGEAGTLIAELEILQDLLHVGGEAVEIGFEIGAEPLLAGEGTQVAQSEFGVL
jgi:hypothetical protein